MSSRPKGATPKVSIIVLNWNGKSVTSECLDSLMKVDYANFEVILVDNNSQDGSQEHFKRNYGWVRLIENEENFGFTGGNNVGIDCALENQSDYILLLNNDTIVDSLFLAELISVAESDEQIGLLNPKIYYYGQPERIWYAGGKISPITGIAWHIGRKEFDTGQYDVQREVDFITGCAFLIKKEVIDKIGVLDEKFFIYSEDVDWTLRALKAGYKAVYVPTSKIWHKEGIDSRSNKGEDFRLYLSTRNILYVMYKNYSLLRFSGFLLLFPFRWLLYMSLKMLLQKDFKAVLALYKGFIDFCFMEKRGEKNQGRS